MSRENYLHTIWVNSIRYKICQIQIEAIDKTKWIDTQPSADGGLVGSCSDVVVGYFLVVVVADVSVPLEGVFGAAGGIYEIAPGVVEVSVCNCFACIGERSGGAEFVE